MIDSSFYKGVFFFHAVSSIQHHYIDDKSLSFQNKQAESRTINYFLVNPLHLITGLSHGHSHLKKVFDYINHFYREQQTVNNQYDRRLKIMKTSDQQQTYGKKDLVIIKHHHLRGSVIRCHQDNWFVVITCAAYRDQNKIHH